MLPLCWPSTRYPCGCAPGPPHLLLIALQEGDEESGDSTGCGVHLGDRHGQPETQAQLAREGLRHVGLGE